MNQEEIPQEESETTIDAEKLAVEDLSTKNLLGMSLFSLLFYSTVAFLLIYFFHEDSISELFLRGYSFTTQLIIGIAAGVGASAVILLLSTRSPIKEVLNDFAIFRVIAKADFSTFDKSQVSLFAGIGEEFLFRGALQPIAGIWIASALFIAIHGYFKFKSAGHILFGVMMFGLSMMLGILFETSGLISAMAAHAVYDLVMLKKVDLLK